MIHSISLITSVGETLSVKAAGSGPVVMLLHGFPLDGRMWTYQLEQLSIHCRCLVPELRGFGGSTASRPYQLSDLADDVEQARRHLAPDEQLHLVGLSMGGYVALEYWHKYSSRLRSLTLANTKPQADDQATKAARLIMAQTAREAGAWAAVQSMLPRLLRLAHWAATWSSQCGPCSPPRQPPWPLPSRRWPSGETSAIGWRQSRCRRWW